MSCNGMRIPLFIFNPQEVILVSLNNPWRPIANKVKISLTLCFEIKVTVCLESTRRARLIVRLNGHDYS